MNELKALTAKELSSLSQELKQELIKLYGDRFDQLILFGSYARGDFHNESDVDFLVVLKDDQVMFGKELDQISRPAGTLSVKYTAWVSAKPVSLRQYNSPDSLFYYNVRREGISQ